MKRSNKITVLLLIGLFLLVAACSPKALSSPGTAAEKSIPIAIYPTRSIDQNTVTVYNLTLELEVDDPRAAAAEAVRLSAIYSGYLVTSQNWEEDGREVVFLEFSVPDDRSARLHSDLLLLGRPTGENYATYAHDCLACRPFSHISLYLRGCARQMPSFPIGGWNPLHTLRSAVGVFIRIFGFLADIAIWLVVVAGPFILLGWGLFTLLRRIHKPDRDAKFTAAQSKPDDNSPAGKTGA